MTVPVCIERGRGGRWEVHREDCRDVAGHGSGGWDVTDWDDLVDQVLDGEDDPRVRIMPCVGIDRPA